MNQLALLNPENISDAEANGYRLRNAARAVVFDAEGAVALLFVALENYYKLPGGGVEDGEDFPAALYRECREVGCEVEIVGELGAIVEYRKFETLRQVSQCYVARVQGEKGVPNYTEKEQEEGFSVVWLPYSKALAQLEDQHATSLEGGEYIAPRDLLFLREARKFFPQF